ncbi:MULTISPECIES: class I SAM-dependent methyltransferase [Rhodopirellula]|jgi:hypothetical protein|uniref:Uncharacterized protein n=1 Tax=Rhodopirellula baltica WH47 TaxID=991778 RepID=F2AZJ1_RHOBT|nr:hypothetical protein [Rhodopirellula baltica]EGF24903.1 hypothetical protein RBWH47_01607 [Rhodopirellula baltica WH47]MCR9206868.1 hypothetical protein [bacterium]|tara:strand:- start:14306 stop:14770 length:465 start_codon:yes stop_codon:yes gene_type:complete
MPIEDSFPHDCCAGNTVAFLDVGGEGRYATAVNLNPSAEKTLGPDKGQPIPNRIDGRAEDIPLPESSVKTIVVERTPLKNEAIEEIARVAADDATLVFRRPVDKHFNPHARVKKHIDGEVEVDQTDLDGQMVQQLTIRRFGGTRSNGCCHPHQL